MTSSRTQLAGLTTDGEGTVTAFDNFKKASDSKCS
jgi:hypothetical protein